MLAHVLSDGVVVCEGVGWGAICEVYVAVYTCVFFGFWVGGGGLSFSILKAFPGNQVSRLQAIQRSAAAT